MPLATPQVVVFDVNETLSDMTPLRARWEAVGAPPHLAQQWFAEVLRDGFALAAAGAQEDFATIAADVARRLLVGAGRDAGAGQDLDAAVAHVMGGFAALEVHPDVADGIRALHDLGIRLVTLTNGATTVADRLLQGADLRDRFEQLLSVSDAGLWKPAAQAYRHALDACGVSATEAMLVAVHPWDVDGASRAGLRTAWVSRTGGRYPAYFRAPDVTVGSLVELAQAVTRGGPAGHPSPGR
ncbi:haloacid dehalogenase type II [Actinotalea sp. K2]|uniref:haloacid dehalogenase type II n=1 Tax=Actinotalea sp. K2 TaxID=2939438 RepID=UPI002016F12F|nr:haloacid dehalogenase type II [Actinotalea sp. K2]MCL3859612.1 haloacid dehalogenase type II [Actinotalea sp. K2]